jgi:hypothetical protein
VPEEEQKEAEAYQMARAKAMVSLWRLEGDLVKRQAVV